MAAPFILLAILFDLLWRVLQILAEAGKLDVCIKNNFSFTTTELMPMFLSPFWAAEFLNSLAYLSM